MRRQWWLRKPPRVSQRCYRDKTQALNVLRSHNQRVIDEHLVDADAEDWGAIEARYGKRVRNVYDAMRAALPRSEKPYCINEFDLDTFRDTDAVRQAEEAGARFTLPDVAHDFQMSRAEEREWIKQGMIDQCYTIGVGSLSLVCRAPWCALKGEPVPHAGAGLAPRP